MNRCETECPVLCDMAASLEQFNARKEEGNHIADAHLEDIIEQTTSAMTEQHGDLPDGVDPATMIRQQMASQLNGLDTLITRGEKRRTALEAGCALGPLAMRATREGTTYTVKVCGSKAVPNEPHEPAYITRKSV